MNNSNRILSVTVLMLTVTSGNILAYEGKNYSYTKRMHSISQSTDTSSQVAMTAGKLAHHHKAYGLSRLFGRTTVASPDTVASPNTIADLKDLPATAAGKQKTADLHQHKKYGTLWKTKR